MLERFIERLQHLNSPNIFSTQVCVLLFWHFFSCYGIKRLISHKHFPSNSLNHSTTNQWFVFHLQYRLLPVLILLLTVFVWAVCSRLAPWNYCIAVILALEFSPLPFPYMGYRLAAVSRWKVGVPAHRVFLVSWNTGGYWLVFSFCFEEVV
jgi:hypothetical protein